MAVSVAFAFVVLEVFCNSLHSLPAAALYNLQYTLLNQRAVRMCSVVFYRPMPTGTPLTICSIGGDCVRLGAEGVRPLACPSVPGLLGSLRNEAVA